MFTLTTSVGQTSGRCITQLAKSIDPKFIELTADVFRGLFLIRLETFKQNGVQREDSEIVKEFGMEK